MASMQEGFPGLTVMLTFGPSLLCSHPQDVEMPLEVSPYGLLVPFVDGLIDAAQGKTRIVDGFERSYGYREAAKFEQAREQITRKAAATDGESSGLSAPGIGRLRALARLRLAETRLEPRVARDELLLSGPV